VFTWGNVSQIDRASGLVAIKPSGVSYDALKPEDIVVLDLDGNIVEGSLRPSSDTPTHLELYRRFEKIGGISHTHSPYATMWAQGCKDLPCFGTTHADYFYGDIPVTAVMSDDEIRSDYELNTGKVIVSGLRGSTRCRCRRCWWPITGRLRGAPMRTPRSKMRSCWKNVPGWPSGH
jgi:L-ribulose-5-phosphate 4-epimerase